MKQFTSHIDFLLQKHDCVIIPDFGGFVLSREQAFVIPDGAIRPPFVVVGFNPDLKSNDGLLAESYMNVYGISYDTASKKIKESVNKLNDALSLGQSVQIGRLGRIKLDDNKQLSFMPNNYLSLYYPETYGLSLARVRPLADIVDPNISLENTKTNKISFKNIVTGAAAAAAAVLIFFVSSTPIYENSDKKEIQQSSFFSDIKILTSSVKSTVTEANKERIANSGKDDLTPSVSEVLSNSPQNNNTINNQPLTKQQSVSDVVNSHPHYYIVIASANSKSEADRALSNLKSQGHKSSKMINTGKDRYRIYVDSFTNKDEAMTYLVNFKKQNPKQSDAWVYSKKG